MPYNWCKERIGGTVLELGTAAVATNVTDEGNAVCAAEDDNDDDEDEEEDKDDDDVDSGEADVDDGGITTAATSPW